MTLAQKKASNPNSSVYVGASAGSGKTKVLTDRVLRLLLDGNDLSKIICLTYTKAAAAEMLSRITARIEKWLTLTDNKLISELEELTDKNVKKNDLLFARKLYFKLIDEIDNIKIYTIHSFCQNLIKKFPIEAEIPPHFKLVDDNTTKELLNEAKIRLLTSNFDESDNEKFIKIQNAIKNISSDSSEKDFSEKIAKIISEKDKFENLFRNKSINDIESDLYNKFDLKKSDTELSLISESYQNIDSIKVKKICITLQASDKKSTVSISSKLKSFFLNNKNKSDILKAFREYKSVYYNSDNINLKKNLLTKDIKENYPEIVFWLEGEKEKFLNLEDKIKSLKIINDTRNYLHIAKAILAIYDNLKQNRAFIDYDDLISKAKNLLNDKFMSPWVLYKLDGGIDHLLIDESQDTSPLQWQVIEAVCEEFFSGDNASEINRTIFIVGDEKQSIYSFQGADPRVFNEVQDSFSAKVTNAKKEWQNISLDKSFRSVEAILNLVDKIFENDEIRNSISKNKHYQRHVSHRSGQYGKVQLWPVFLKDKNNSSGEAFDIPDKIVSKDDVHDKVAIQVADNIEQWFKEKRYLKSTGKIIEPDDIMILVRKRKNIVDAITQKLQEKNIPVSGVDRIRLKDNIIIKDLLAFANFLLCQSDDLNLACLLKSSFISLTEIELFDLCYKRKNNSLWKVIEQRDEPRFNEIYDYLSSILKKVDFQSPFEIFNLILNENDNLRKINSFYHSENDEVISEFLSLVLQYESSHIPTLQGFLSWFKTNDSDIKKEVDKPRGKIRIMTIHASKGLQSPIVILPDAVSLKSNSSDNLLFSNDEVLVCNKVEDLNKYCKSIKDKKQQNEYDEYLRLLYVALTRAEDEIYVTGSCSKNSKIDEKSWYKIIQKELLKIGKKDNDNLTYESGTACKISHNNSIITTNNDMNYNEIPNFIKLNYKIVESEESLSIINPSRIENNTDILVNNNPKAAIKGKIIHKLLQILPDISANDRLNVIEKYLYDYKGKFNVSELNEITTNITSVLNNTDISVVYGKNSKAETPIIGNVNNKIISGRIDRLRILEDRVIIVDYKTNAFAPDVSDINISTLKQIEIYKQLIQEIYPNKTVEAYLVWTSNGTVTKV